MSFLEAFESQQQAAFERMGDRLVLQPGEYLLRRGDPGGDIFLLRNGSLEVVDTRSTPEVVIAVLEPGAMVGEMSFLDGSPRSADVRCGSESEIIHWTHQDLSNMLKRSPAVAATFYEQLAKTAARRVRTLTNRAVAGALNHGTTEVHEGLDRVRSEAQVIAGETKEALIECETALRGQTDLQTTREDVSAALDNLQTRVHELFEAFNDDLERQVAGEVLHKELRPYLVRSSLAERAIRRPGGLTATAEIMSHVLIDTAGGEGQLGELLDRWLLQRPTLTGFRSLPLATASLVKSSLPKHRNRRLMLVNAWTGSLVARLISDLAELPTVLTVVDQSKDALAFLGAGMAQSNASVDLQTVQENLAQFALGRWRHAFPPQDTIILHGLLEYMPERIALSLLSECSSRLSSDGQIVAGALLPSADQQILDHLLRWPTIRRDRHSLQRLFETAGLAIHECLDLPGPALLFRAVPAA